ncbi:pectate lyase 4-like [Hordeum vulgare subsp. vulgare]|uniref:pectate lyase 4-like n=1 Tax=Hordeum vulgare subsp. vulgare TaxID=112509 RepID=UPI001D1A575E|nr:pectate lyase 4-like [Hordeum vulgare subsp. vulgare]
MDVSRRRSCRGGHYSSSSQRAFQRSADHGGHGPSSILRRATTRERPANHLDAVRSRGFLAARHGRPGRGLRPARHRRTPRRRLPRHHPQWYARHHLSVKVDVNTLTLHPSSYTEAERCVIQDDGPGSLRDGCRRQEPLWIVFDVSGTIRLASGLRVSSHKTVDGRGRRVTLSGKGLLLRECEHVILCNLEVEGGRGHDADAVQIKPGSRHVWVDRCSLRDFADGLLDVTCGSTDVTVSRCRFSAHDKAVLIGASSGHVGDRRIRVTIHHCLFDGTRQRQPRVRFGRVHLYNNYTRGWGIYAVCASVESQIVSQCNIYEAGEKKKVFMYMTEQVSSCIILQRRFL